MANKETTTMTRLVTNCTLATIAFLAACTPPSPRLDTTTVAPLEETDPSPFSKYPPKTEMEYPEDARPYARYWWFAEHLTEADIRYNLDYLRDNGFGGVEIAWVYPRNAMDAGLDTTYTPRPTWLGEEWRHRVAFTQRYADSIGLGCDLTLGTLWPFGDSRVPYARAAQRYGESERQRIVKSWEHPTPGYVVDHLDPAHYQPYFDRLLGAFPPPVDSTQAYFVDSWEVKTEKLWAEGFGEEFETRYGYDIRLVMDELFEPKNRTALYDYRKLVSEKVVGFYADFDRSVNAHGVLSRGQCSGAPADALDAYAALDIPEGEAMLYEPEFSAIPSSAATLSGKNLVSAEAFTCLYGWPRDYLRREQTADLKLVADALFAGGVNHLVWHGRAHNPVGSDSINFYATVHLGPSGSLAKDLPAFNAYLTETAANLRRGRPYTDVAVYLPTEEAWIKGEMPPERQFIWAREFYEMRYVDYPAETRGHHPTWINETFLRRAIWDGERLRVGDADFGSLYVDTRYLGPGALARMGELARAGLPLTLKQVPQPAGSLDTVGFAKEVKELHALPNVRTNFRPATPPLVVADQSIPFRARRTETGLLLFCAHPASEGLTFPIGYGQAAEAVPLDIPITVNFAGQTHVDTLNFERGEAIMLELSDGMLRRIDGRWQPPGVKREVREGPEPWRRKN